MVVDSARPMEDVARIANTELVLWLVQEYGYDRWDAYQLLTQAGGLYVDNMLRNPLCAHLHIYPAPLEGV